MSDPYHGDPKTKHCHDVIIATAALLGGIPIRRRTASGQHWWSIDETEKSATVFGYSRTECAYKWLTVTHPEIKLPWR